MTFAALLSSIVFAVCGQVLFKAGMNRVGRIGRGERPRWSAGASALALGLVAFGSSMLLWLYTLSRVELSFAFPFVSLSYVGIVLVARFGLGERVGRHRLMGSALIVLGVLIVSMTR